jgi:hypothetical protein
MFRVDTTAPETTVGDGPTGTTSDSTATFTFDSSEGSSTFECRVDDTAFSSCSSPHTTSPLSNGSHTFQVRAIDGAGNVDPTRVSRSWTIAPDYRQVVLPTAGLVSYWLFRTDRRGGNLQRRAQRGADTAAFQSQREMTRIDEFRVQR